MSEAHAEAKVHRRLDNAAGIYVTFLIHPQDAEALDGLRIGASVQLAWAEVVNTEVEKIDLPTNRAAKGEVPATAETPREPRTFPPSKESWKDCVTKPKRAFKDLPLSQQAGIRSTDKQFAKFLETRWSEPCKPEYQADWIRMECCGIKSRAELDTNGEAANSWLNLEGHFQSWLLTEKYADVLR